MNDLISRQAVLDIMQMRMSGKELYKAVYELPTVTLTQKWIPVSERLPEYGTEVLTCSRGGYVEIQSLETYGEYWENQHGDWTDFDEVIAWMPLPSSYQGE